METIFDHNVTDEELDLISPDFTREQYRELMEKVNSQESEYIAIAQLMTIRNDIAGRDRYLDKIQDERDRWYLRIALSKLS